MGSDSMKNVSHKAKELGYDYIICTVMNENEAEIAILRKYGWRQMEDSIWNKETEHLVSMWSKRL